MVPAAFVRMQRMPLTVHGKIDREGLPVPEWNQTSECEYEAPRTPVEEALVRIFAEVLNQKRIGIHDNFFHRGGNSLLVVRVVNQIREEFDVEVAMGTFFSGPTVARLAQLIIEQQIQKKDTDEVSALLDRLENLSADEVKKQ